MRFLTPFLLLLVACSTPLTTAPTPSPSPTPTIALQHVKDIILQLADASSCTKASWKERGHSPSGYVPGMSLAYARSLCRLRSGKSTIADLTGKTLGSSSKDALSWYPTIGDVSGELAHLKAWALGIGLGMRESSGQFCEGRDMSVALSSMKDPAGEAEAGGFQQSYNSRGVSVDAMNGLWAWYRQHGEFCDLSIWAKGVNTKSTGCMRDAAGAGPGASWQDFTRQCPAFSAEWAMVLLRNLRQHFGPLNRHEAEFKTECVDLLSQVNKLVAAYPLACDQI